MFILIVAFYDRFSSLSGDEKPFTCVGQVLVLNGQVFGQYALALRQSVRVRAEQLIVFVLVLIVTISRREYVIVELHHGNHASMQQIFRVHDFGTGVLPKPCQHVGSVNCHIGFYAKPFLKDANFIKYFTLLRVNGVALHMITNCILFYKRPLSWGHWELRYVTW